MLQHIATRWPNARNMLRPTMLRHVVLACCNRLAWALLITQRFQQICQIFHLTNMISHSIF